MCESFLTDEAVARKFSEKVQKENRSLWEKIKDFFTDLINRLKEAYKGLDPQSENGRLVREMTNDLTKVKEAWAELVVESGKVEKVTSESEVKKSAKDFEDYNKPITLADVETLRSIGRKSINKFTAEDIKKAQKWAYKFYQELNVKSPFFRAWFGEWRAYDNTTVALVDSKADARKTIINMDTRWEIQTSKKVHKETSNHRGSPEVNAVKYLQYIDDITKKAVLFDSVISNKDNPNSLMFHIMYAYTEAMGYPALLRLKVEELFYHNNETSGELKRDYILQNIEEEPLSKRNRLSRSNHSDKGSSTISISDLYELVKTFDKEFTPAPEVNKVLLNEDGTPKKFYHGTDAKFTEFKPEEMSHKEGSYFFAENREDAEAYGKNIHEVYLTGRNLADYDNQHSEFYKLRDKRKQVEWLKERRYDGWYADMDSDGWGELSVFSPEQIKSAKGNIGTFSKYETDTKYSRKIPDPYTSRELLAKALTKVAKGDEKVLLEQYKSNLRMIEGEVNNLKNLRKEIDAIKYKKSITYKGENLSVKEFEQRAYTQAETMGVNSENCINNKSLQI